MYFEFSAEQITFRDTVKRLVESRAPLSYVRSMYDDERGTTQEMWQALVDLGITSILVPESYGGMGLGMVDMGLALEVLGSSLHPGPYFSSAVAATLAITSVDDGEQGDLLSAMASGHHIATLALFEPGRRYEWTQPTATASISSTGWTVTGIKVHVGDAMAADTILVVAGAPDGLGLFAVDRTVADACPEPSLDGTRKQAEVILRAAPARRIGSDDATSRLSEALDRILIGVAIDSVGTAQTALDLSSEYAKTRHQFDRPIGSFQAVQALCVDMHCQIENSRSLAYYALWAADDVDQSECHRAAMMAKGFTSGALAKVGETAIQVHGGIGVTWEHPIGLYYKRCLSMQSAFGDSRDQFGKLASIILQDETS
jgi:alkylation response protein AidB-like acyl-CoA dehydrogenase